MVENKPIDRFSLYHFLGGVSLGLIRLKFTWALAIILGWEIIEQGYLAMHKNGSWKESLPNSILDIVFGILGYIVGKSIGN